MASHVDVAREVLEQTWAEVMAEEELTAASGAFDESVDKILDGNEVGYKKLIIIQLVGKAADMDAHSLQKGSGNERAWDAREFAKRVFVPWNADVGYPLGHADDPYVSNQFRTPRFDSSIRGKRRSKVLFDEALRIISAAEASNSRSEVEELLKRVLRGVRRQMQQGTFDYPLPARASLADVLGCINEYLAEKSGGTRLQAITHALFEAIAAIGVPYEQLFSRSVNAADVSTNSPGDVSFRLDSQAWATEVKDRVLTAAQVEVSVNKARVSGVTELLFIILGPRPDQVFESTDEESAVAKIMKREFSSGLNVYCEPFISFARAALVIVGERGRRQFLEAVGRTLEVQRADARHRWEWARAVKEL